MTDMHLAGATWRIGSQLEDGEGGFGRVFDVTDEAGRAAVAKLVDQDPGAERELLMGDSIRAAQARNVIPVLDTGEHEGQWVIVMPKADTSLRAHLAAATPPLDEAFQILRDVATALSDLALADPAIIHRDLKPANVLRLDGTWCLADFGIARYAEQTTSVDTRKWNLTRPYAAPEQWRMERATPATDVYAFGVMAFELLTGGRPFNGPDFRHQHLTETAPPLTTGTTRLRTLVEESLYKAPAARPSAANMLARLEQVSEEPTTPGASRLSQMNAQESERLAQDYASSLAEAERADSDAALFDVAKQSFEAVTAPLLAAIQADAPLANIEHRSPVVFIAQLRHGRLGVTQPSQVRGWNGPFHAIASAAITVNQAANFHGYEGRSHSLWFCDAQEEGRYGWYETAFMDSAFSGGGMRSVAPYSVDPSGAGVAFTGGIGTVQLAWPFQEVDRADPIEFVDRWLGWFADAAGQAMSYPSMMPEKSPGGSYRRE